MKVIALNLGVLIMLVTAAIAAPRTRTFTGEIMDNFCATAGSHKSMWTEKGDPNSPRVRKLCTLKCVEMGGKFVLYNKAAKTAYQLDDQQKPRPFAGEEVKITGTYDPKTQTIHVKQIVPVA